jgi:hypothetical protein
MEDFKLSSKGIYQVLKKKGIEYLHHANTVATSLTFIEVGALLSRQFVEANDLNQTVQKSDTEDKKFDVWDSVFLDGEDLHKRYRRANKYGPVLFKLKLDLLISPSIQYLYVTKSNPWYWKDSTTIDQKYYKTIDELSLDYLTGKRLDSQIMFTIRTPEREIKLKKYLHSIVIDIPKLFINTKNGEELTVGEYAFGAINDALNKHGLGHITVLKRHDGKLTFCSCLPNYNYLHTFKKTEFKKIFAKMDEKNDANNGFSPGIRGISNETNY